MPTYIQKALRIKDEARIMPRAKTHTLHGLTMSEIMSKLRDITKALSYDAKRNGYRVNYILRLS